MQRYRTPVEADGVVMTDPIEALARALHDRPDVCGCDEWPCTDSNSAAYWRNDAADLSKLLRENGFELHPSSGDHPFRAAAGVPR
jgi:hypothetical protein